MKFNEQWLRELVDLSVDRDTLSHQLTMAGLEVDAMEPVAPAFSGVVVGEILAAEPHPDADKLRVCQVAFGGEAPIQVVCGAPNARVGLKVAFATVGAVLPGDFKIKKAKLRGVESFGMLCGADEIGLESAQSDGLLELAADAPVGADLRDYLQLDDVVFEIGLTPNRADCLSVTGIARDIAAIQGVAFRAPEIEPVTATLTEQVPVTLYEGSRCPSYCGRVIKGIDIARPTPVWMSERLRRAGLRSVDAVVDVTNYVLLELGQPMHAFDLSKLSGGIDVRLAHTEESLTLLDGKTITLMDSSLVIADQEKALALAGIMGGAQSAVSDTTVDLFLEAAHFAPVPMAGQARAYGLHTDSSHRFERGVDPALPALAIERATALLLELVGGEAGPLVETRAGEPAPLTRVSLRRERIERVLGFTLTDAQVEGYLGGLGMPFAAQANGWDVTVPSWRFDITQEVDLIEELARLYGYNAIPTRRIRAEVQLAKGDEASLDKRELRRRLVALGYQEAITYSFVDPKIQSQIAPELTPVALQNPISADLSVMRTSLWGGLIPVVRHNLNRQQDSVRLFETGLRFVRQDEQLQQEPMLAIVLCGRRHPESWSSSDERVDFFDLKGDIEALLGLTARAQDFRFVPGAHPLLHPGQCASIELDGQSVGILGALHPQQQKLLDIDQPLFLFEITQAALLQRRLPTFESLSRFPEVRRDLALIVDEKVTADALKTCALEASTLAVRSFRIFDVYRGKGIDPQRKSVAVGLTFQELSRTLNDDEVNQSVDAIVGALTEAFGATLRK